MSAALFISGESHFPYHASVLSARGLELVHVGSIEKGCHSFYEHSIQLVLIDAVIAREGSAEIDRLLDECSRFDAPIIMLGDQDELKLVSSRSRTAMVDIIPSAPLDVSLLAARADVLLKVKARVDELKEQAVVDELTRAYNRGYFERQINLRVKEAKRYNTPFSLVLFDLDRFKAINDTRGHPFGDFVLREVARIVREAMRKEDVLARYGGEEFAIMLPHTDRLGSAILTERIRESVSEHKFERNDVQQRVTISLGSASMPSDEVTTAEALIELTDQRLYQAKRHGANRAVCE